MFGLSRKNVLSTSVAPGRGETTREQMQRLRYSWSIIDGDDQDVLFIPTVTYKIGKEQDVLPLSTILGKRETTEIYKVGKETLSYMQFRKIGAFSLHMESMAFRMTSSNLAELEDYSNGAVMRMPYRGLPVECGSTIKIVDPSIPPQAPVGETALLRNMAETNLVEYADLFMVQLIRSCKAQVDMQLAAI